MNEIELNPSQQKACEEINASIIMRRPHLLTGYAGAGKTTLVQAIAMAHHAKHARIVLTAPTHKAVAVLERKLKAAGINIPCRTIHSLLSLRPKAQGDKQIFVRAPKAKPVNDDIIIVDEASMLDQSMMTHIDRHLSGRAVVFVGDPAQLPPVGEVESRSFSTMPASHLETIVRQAEGNPILQASAIIRASQSKEEMDWSWAYEARGEAGTSMERTGVFTPPRNDVDAWLKRAFTSDAFSESADFARYLCWTNARVAEINQKIRRWLHGDEATRPGMPPFVPGEIALIRSPLVVENTILISINEEVRVIDIAPSSLLNVATWEMKVRTEEGMDHDIHTPRDMDGYRIALGELADAAKGAGGSWEEYHDFKAAFIQAQQCMALTVHNSQGGTFRFAFMDISDIRKRQRDNPLECKKLLYTAATRPTDGLVLVGV